MTASKTDFTSIDHIGWDLWRATQSWKRRFTSDMVAAGFGWYGEARGGLIQHIGTNGIAQIDLAARTSMSKQAVQQHLDDLVRDGIVERLADANDARKKQIRFTPAGIKALKAANRIKQQIEADYRRLIGPAAMKELARALALIIDSEA